MKQLYAATEAKAWEKLDKALQEQKQGILATGPKRKLGDHLTWWLDEVHQQKIRHTTYARYRFALDKHIVPELGNIPLHKLTAQMIQSLYNSKAKEGQSPSSIQSMHNVLHKGLSYAVQARLIPYNPSDNVSLPRQIKRKVKPLTLEQAKLLIQVAQGSHLEMLIMLALITGMRHGELITLRWEDIDLEKGTIYVHRTGGYQSKKYRGISGFLEGEPKTEAGERIIPISKKLCEELKQYRSRQNEKRSKAGTAWKELNLVCPNSRNGNFLDHTNVRESFYRLLKKAGLPLVHIHDLRHNAATLMRSRGVDLKVIQEILGHSSMDITANIYSHVLPSMQIEAAERMNALLE